MSDKVIILSLEDLVFLDSILKNTIDQLHSKLYFRSSSIAAANEIIGKCDSIRFKITEVINE